MEITELRERSEVAANKKLSGRFYLLKKLLEELRKKDIPDDFIKSFNTTIDEVNQFSGTDKELLKKLKSAKKKILNPVIKQLKLTPKGYYMSIYMAVGMSAVGVPIGVAFGVALDNMGFMGIGLPMGMSAGLAIGIAMDKKAENEGKQLDLSLDK